MDRKSRLDKQAAITRIHEIIGVRDEPLGPGSKEHKETFLAVAKFVGMKPTPKDSKQQLAASLCSWLGGQWDATCYSAGDTVTLEGITRILSLLEATASISVDPERFAMDDVSAEETGESASNEFEQDEDEERDALKFSVAELISALSLAEEAPNGVEQPGYSFAPSEIDFSSNSWMANLSAVQGWLRLPGDLDLSEPHLFLEQLARALGIDFLAAVTRGKNDSLEPSDLLLEGLRARLDRATQNLEKFLEALESDGSTLTTATAVWNESWEEEDDEFEGSGPVSAKTTTRFIIQFSEDARRGRLNLSPSYQRGDVWPTKDYQVLIESILRGIPLPSIILLKPNDKLDSKGLSTRAYEVVDGKQRLTAILRFTGRHPSALELVKRVEAEHPKSNLLNLFETDYPKFRRKWKNLLGEALTASKERDYFFPFKLRNGKTSLSGSLKALEGKYFTQILEREVQVSDETCTIDDVFRSNVYLIPVIEFLRASPRQIHEVFELYNKQGKHLNAEEIRNAVYHELDMTRSLIVASGDNKEVQQVAPCLLPIWANLSDFGQLLEQYATGITRYKRTKLLSWLVATLVFDSTNAVTGRPMFLSTARQIDALLERISDNPDDSLRNGDVIRDLFSLVHMGVKAHASIDEAWAPIFKDTQKGAKWQELQLIGSLLGVVSGAALLGEEIQDRLETAAEIMREISATPEWKRPEKTQTKSQWEYISKIALRVMEVLDVEPVEASGAVAARFGASGIKALTTIAFPVGE